MKIVPKETFRVKRFHTDCSFRISAYGTKDGHAIQLRDGDIEGDRDLFAYKAFMFLLDYMREKGIRTSKSFNNWLCNAALDALYHMCDKHIVTKKSNPNV